MLGHLPHRAAYRMGMLAPRPVEQPLFYTVELHVVE